MLMINILELKVNSNPEQAKQVQKQRLMQWRSEGGRLSPGAGLGGGAKSVTKKVFLKLCHNNSQKLV